MTEIINKCFVVPEGKHSSRGASGMDRWEQCPGSVQLSERVAESQAADDSGEAADEGTAAHEIAAHCLRHGLEAWMVSDHTVNVRGRVFPVDADMTAAVQIYLDYVDMLMNRYADFEPELHIERHMRHSKEKDVYGTADVFIIVKRLGLVIVIDYKHGKGIIVEPHKPQTKYYANLALDLMDNTSAGYDSDGVVFPIEKIICTIVQPRAPHRNGPIRSNELTLKQLQDWVEFELKFALKRTYEKDPVFKAGDWCRFCRARLICAELIAESEAVDTGVKPLIMMNDDLLHLLSTGDAIKKFLGDVAIEAQRRMEAGTVLPGWKLVDKLAKRVFVPGFETIARSTLGDRAFSAPELLSPAQMEKIPGGKALVVRYAHKPRTGVTIATADDAREARTSLLDQASAFVEANHSG